MSPKLLASVAKPRMSLAKALSSANTPFTSSFGVSWNLSWLHPPAESRPRIGANGLDDSRAQAAHSASSIELPGKRQAAKNRDLPIRHAGPCVDVAAPRPVLTTIIAGYSEAQRMVKHGPRPRCASRIGWLARLLAGFWKPEALVPPRLPAQTVQNPAL